MQHGQSKGTPQAVGARPLLDLCIECLSANLQHFGSLQGISEELAVVLFQVGDCTHLYARLEPPHTTKTPTQDVLSKARLTPHALRLFEQLQQHDALLNLIQTLNITTPPPVLPTSCAGKAPKWF